MIDEETKKQILAKLPKVIQDWSKETIFDKPRPRSFRIAKIEHDGVHYPISIIVGKDEKETWKMAEELTEWHKKYTSDQNDITRGEDYTVRKY